MSYIKHISLLVLVFLVSNGIYSQKEKKYIRQGTEDYLGKNYGNSEVSYQKALTSNSESFEAKFNLGDAFYKQEKYDEAIKEFSDLASKSTDKEKLGKIYHNIGNSQLNQTKKLLSEQKIDESIKQISKSIESYKSALKNNPADRETKFNLGYAQQLKKMLENQKNKNEQNKDKNQQDKDKQDQQEKNNQDQNQDKNQNKPSENDSDGDGIPNKEEQGNNQDKPRDTDKDGTPDDKDTDSDNDGKPDSEEAGKNPDKPQDTDKDGLPDYRDLDSNNDGKPDSQDVKQNPDDKISKEDALRILDAILNDEKDVQGKLKKIKGVKTNKLEKDW